MNMKKEKGQIWYVGIPDQTCLLKAQVEQVTRKTVVLRFCWVSDVHPYSVRYRTADVDWVELAK